MMSKPSIGDNLKYQFTADTREEYPILMMYDDPTLSLTNCFTEIDRTRHVSFQRASDFMVYRITSADFWRETFDVRKQIWSE